MANLHRTRQAIIAEIKQKEMELLAFDARRDARAREQAISTAARKIRIFRDGSPRDSDRHGEIARRYAWDNYKKRYGLSSPGRRQTGKDKLITMIRLRELERLYSRRHGGILPNNVTGSSQATIAAHHIAYLGGDMRKHIASWMSVWAPWMGRDEVTALTTAVEARPLKFKADTLGWRLRLSNEERYELKITTIGATDVNKDQRSRFRKTKRAFEDRVRRRQKGSIPRVQYESSSLTRSQPWVKHRMSRATWYRKGKPS
jgi:hypothetical protein